MLRMHAKLMLHGTHDAHDAHDTQDAHNALDVGRKEAGGNLKSMVPNKRNSADIIGQLPPKTHKWAPQVG